MSNQVTRRNFLKAGAVGAAALLANPSEGFAAASPRVLFGPLSTDKEAFLGAKIQRFGSWAKPEDISSPKDCTVQNMQELISEAGAKPQYITVSAGFNGCDIKCPSIHKALKAIGDANTASTTMLFIDTMPSPKDEDKKALIQTIRASGVKQPIILISAASENQATEMQQAYGNIAYSPENHTSSILLYRPNRTFVDKKIVPNNVNPKEFEQWIANTQGKSRE